MTNLCLKKKQLRPKVKKYKQFSLGGCTTDGGFFLVLLIFFYENVQFKLTPYKIN